MSHARVFNESVFHSYTNLKAFFDQSNAVNEVLEHRNETFSKPLPILNPKLAGKWQVCQIVSAPFRWISAIALAIIATIANALGAQHFSQSLSTCVEDLKRGFNDFSENNTHLFKLADSLNAPNAEGRIVNESTAIPVSRIPDPKVESRTFCMFDNEIQFNHVEGICRGESYWFLYLYLKTKNQFSDPRSHMTALCNQFKDGGGMEATLLQSIFLKKGKLLDLKIGTQPAHSRGILRTELIKKTPHDWRNSSQAVIQELQDLSAGGYAIGLPRHLTAFVKISPTLSYFFDPNHGVTEISGPDQGELLYQIMTETLDELENESPADSSCIRHLTVTPVSLRL